MEEGTPPFTVEESLPLATDSDQVRLSRWETALRGVEESLMVSVFGSLWAVRMGSSDGRFGWAVRMGSSDERFGWGSDVIRTPSEQVGVRTKFI